MSSVVVELPLMVDLALGSPQLGAVNFNILHSLLHVMIQQLRLTDTLVEIRGNTGVVVNNLLTCNKAGGGGPSITLSEFELQEPAKLAEGRYQSGGPPRSAGAAAATSDKDEGTDISKKGKKVEKKKKTSLQKLVVVKKIGEVLEATAPVTSQAAAKPTAAPAAAAPAAAPSGGQAGGQDIQGVTQRVASIEKHIHMLEELPTHKEILDQIRSGQGNVVSDVWNIILLSKRMEAAESGINKLTSVIEQVAKEYTNVNVDLAVVKTDGSKDEVRGRLDTMEKRIYDLEVGGGGRPIGTPPSPQGMGPAPINTSVLPPPEPMNSGNAELDEAIQSMRDNIYTLQNEVEHLKMVISEVAAGGGVDGVTPIQVSEAVSEDGRGGEIGVNLDNLSEIEDKLQKFGVQMTGLDSNFNKQMACFQKQITSIEKEVGVMLERINAAGLPMPDAEQEFSGLGELYTKIQGLQRDMDHINATATSLLEDREERQVHINALLEQIEFLKTVKADKEDLEDALADKADHHLVNRKVSHDQFDAACDDLSRGLEEALSKLTEQETLWQVALDDVQKEIENKLDKIEISPLKDFVNNKLKSLQDRLKALASLKKDSEAAGTRSKYMRNVNCISCDKDVVMRTDEVAPQIAIPGVLPPNMSMKPYLTYELDAVRKQQRQLPNRNLNHFEMAMKEEKKKKGFDRTKCEDLGKTHVCNRYCGGSHTTTTPQQRVTRMGHFIQQWGPEAIKLTEGITRGTDNRLYKTVEAEKRLSSTGPEGRPNTRTSDTCLSPDAVPPPSEGHKSPTKAGSKTSLAPSRKSTSPRGSVDKLKRSSKSSASKLAPVPEAPGEGEGEHAKAEAAPEESPHADSPESEPHPPAEGEEAPPVSPEGEEPPPAPTEGGDEAPPPEEA